MLVRFLTFFCSTILFLVLSFGKTALAQTVEMVEDSADFSSRFREREIERQTLFADRKPITPAAPIANAAEDNAAVDDETSSEIDAPVVEEQRVESNPVEPVKQVQQPTEALSPSRIEQMRRARMRVELKNEEALLEKLEALRLRDENERLKRLGVSSAPTRLQSANQITPRQ